MATTNIMIVGVGGQGTLLTSRILGNLAVVAGYDVKISEVHGLSQRGGSVVTYVRYGESVAEPIVEAGQVDVLIAFERLEALRYLHYVKKDGTVIVNNQRIDPITVVSGQTEYPEGIIDTITSRRKTLVVDAMDVAKAIGSPKSFNIVVLGAAAKSMDYTVEQWEDVIKNTVPPKTVEKNLEAFRKGYDL
ncbi:MAG: indolepyruvate oxidoreductase subunit beta [Lachnospiraceae bacterium]|nr:indolepyruvate oxidoreductase subunit beta [Candidatus Colinaster equi]